MSLLESMAERIYIEAFPSEDRKGWENEREPLRDIFREYAAAAQGVLLDHQNLLELLALLDPAARRRAARALAETTP